MEPTLNFQVPAEGLQQVILLHTQYLALRHRKLIINDDSHLKLFCLIEGEQKKYTNVFVSGSHILDQSALKRKNKLFIIKFPLK